MVKYLFIIFLLIVGGTTNISGQKIESLNKADSPKELNDSTSIIYGLFIQRLGFTSGGFPQEIRLQNIITDKIYTFNVKGTMKSGKENPFCYYLKPGMYKLFSYFWTKSKWYGGEMHEERIFKNIDTSTKDYIKRVKNGSIDPDKLEPYYLEIRPNSVYYIGTWHFNTVLVSFSDDKTNLDEQLKKKYSKVDFDQATTKLPE